MFTRKLAAPLLFSMTAMSFPSHALLLDFIDMADSSLSQGTNIGTIGERGFSSGMDSSNTGAFSSLFSELGLTITATKNMVSASPYLDQGTAGWVFVDRSTLASNVILPVTTISRPERTST